MNKIAIEALCKSIEHWYNNWELAQINEVPQLGSYQCALCVSFIDDNCIGCPVFAFTGQPSCTDTPYTELMDLMDLRCNPRNRIRKTVEREYAFLVGLLP